MAEVGRGEHILQDLNGRLGRYIVEAQKLEKENRELKERLDIMVFQEKTDTKPLLLEKARQLEEEIRVLERERAQVAEKTRKLEAEIGIVKASTETKNTELENSERDLIQLQKQEPLLQEELSFVLEVKEKERETLEKKLQDLEGQEKQLQETSRVKLEKMIQDERKEHDATAQKEKDDLTKHYQDKIKKLQEQTIQIKKDSEILKQKTEQDEKEKLQTAKEALKKLRQEHEVLGLEQQRLHDDINVIKLNNIGKSRAEHLGKLQYEARSVIEEFGRIDKETDNLTKEIQHYRALLQQANKEPGSEPFPETSSSSGNSAPIRTPPVKRVKLFISPSKSAQPRFREVTSGAVRIKEVQQDEKNIELENLTNQPIDLKDWCLKLFTNRGESYSEVFPEGALLEEHGSVIAEIKDERSAAWFTDLQLGYYVLLANNLGETVAQVDVDVE